MPSGSGLYNSLTQSQKDSLYNSLDNMARPYLADFAKLLNHFDLTVSMFNATGSGVLYTLGASEVIPNRSNLGGAGDMTQTQWVAFINAINSVNTTYNTPANRQNMALAAGGTNLIG